jgi:hypothetical protein
MEKPGSPEALGIIRSFLTLALGETVTGYLCLAFLPNTPTRKFRERWYSYPDQLDEAVLEIKGCLLTDNVYFCPQLFSQQKRRKEYVRFTPSAWADLDACDPRRLQVEPSMLWESSPGRHQALWLLDRVAPEDAEALSRRIAYAHAEDGCDRSGWDLTQLLRVPYTYNYKYGTVTNHPIVTPHRAGRERYRLDDFPYEEVAEYLYDKFPYPDRDSLEGMDADELLASKGRMLPPSIWHLYNTEPEPDRKEGWSGALWNLLMLLGEYGFTREETLVIAIEAKCNKYARDGRSNTMLWADVCRAFSRLEKQSEQDTPSTRADDNGLLSDEERDRVRHMEPTFIEHYIEWARTTGDAAQQYHQAGAFVALSTILSGNLVLPTSFGTIVPNLWFMILADTTLTRKTTAMDLAMDCVEEVDIDALLATDGSVEGLMTALSTRPGRPSVFLRDEFSGLLEAMSKKDYLAGMPEVLTKLYDGKSQKRLLKKETIAVTLPRLIIFAGGIKNKVTGILTHEQVSSGFMPRFVFITAESDVTRVKPLGPPSERTDNGRAVIIAALTDIASHYQQVHLMEVSGPGGQVGGVKAEVRKVYSARLTDDAWIRYNSLEYALLNMGLQEEYLADVLTPTYDRLAKSILKAAVLLAASVQRSEEVVVDEDHILRAIHYGERWKTYADDVIGRIGRSSDEQQLDRVIKSLANHPEGLTKSKLMQWHHLNARTTSIILDTLEQRGVLVRRKSGRGETLFITQFGASLVQ